MILRINYLIVLGFLICASPAKATDGGEVALDSLPQVVTKRIKESSFRDAQLLHARKEVENGKSCYQVTMKYEGRVIDLYVSTDGHAITSKETFSLSELPVFSMVFVLFILLPAAIVGAGARWFWQTATGRRIS